jgi:hypothetical protein
MRTDATSQVRIEFTSAIDLQPCVWLIPEHRPRIAGLIGQRLNNDDGQAECSFGGMPISRVGDDVANADERVGDGLPDAGCGSWRC